MRCCDGTLPADCLAPLALKRCPDPVDRLSSWFKTSGCLYSCWMVWRCFSIHSRSLFAVQYHKWRAILLAAVRGTQRGVALQQSSSAFRWGLRPARALQEPVQQGQEVWLFPGAQWQEVLPPNYKWKLKLSEWEALCSVPLFPPQKIHCKNKIKEKKSNGSFSSCDFDLKSFESWSWQWARIKVRPNSV